MFIVGIGSGMFNSPNTAAMMGTVAPHRRGIAAGARVLVQNTGAVISIAFVLAVVTSAVPKHVLFAVFSGVANHISTAELAPFISNMHTALWCLTAVSLVGARSRQPARRKSGRRPRWTRRARGREPTAERTLRIGELAELTGTTPRTIRYYEEIGLLTEHRSASRASTAPTRRPTSIASREILRLRDLLGVSLEQLSQLLEAEDAAPGCAANIRRATRRLSASGSSSVAAPHRDAAGAGPGAAQGADRARRRARGEAEAGEARIRENS